MKVLAWKSYGEIDVISADTQGQLAKIAEDVISIIESWKVNDRDLLDAIEGLKNDIINCNVSRSDVRELVNNWGFDTPDFESFDFVVVQ